MNIYFLMKSIPADGCALITSDVNRRYFTGMKSSAGLLAVFHDTAYLLVDSRYIEKARETVDCAEVIELKASVVQLKELLKKHNVSNVHIESETMSVHEFHFYKSKFEEYHINDTDFLSNIINEMREVKSQYEIYCIKKAQEIAESAFGEMTKCRPNMTEWEFSRKLDWLMLEKGAESVSFETIVLSGRNTSMPHGIPSNMPIGEGFLLVDFGAVVGGYHSDMTRTLCIGTPNYRMTQVYETVLAAQEKALKNAAAGKTGKQIDAYARSHIVNSGYGEYFGHSLGHGLGLEIHENPSLSEKNEKILKSGTVVTIEPGIYIPHEFGVRIEDTVILTNDGCVNLTKTEKNLIILH